MYPLSSTLGPHWLLAVLLLATACGRPANGPPPPGSPAPISVPATRAAAWEFGDLPPRAENYPPELVERLQSAWSSRSTSPVARTRHLREDGSPRYTNRLFLETSPYLQQHAHNPVDWHPWGDAAFEKARRLGRPVLLSVGYSTCHWCHVMEEESFEDPEIAAVINSLYVAIKVDREERPDVDGVYMAAVQTMTRQGGWPMTVWLMPDRKPFYAATYLPPRDGDRQTRYGFLTLLQRLSQMYMQQRGQVVQAADTLTEAIRQALMPMGPASGQPQEVVILKALDTLRETFDHYKGGLDREPKFPSHVPHRLLFRQYIRLKDEGLLDMSLKTLREMARGGIRDQVGGGFHRYSTDRNWLVPHFEKMLYDNALVSLAYAEAFQLTGNGEFGAVARDTLDYVLREMTSLEGGFYSATDADSETPSGKREEGWYFTWTPEEMSSVLGPEMSTVATAYFGLTASGNFEGRNILHVPQLPAQVAEGLGMTESRLQSIITSSRQLLYEARQQRPPPARDEKILVSWNGLMISALARTSFAFGAPVYADAAARAASFILQNMRRHDRLLRSYKDGEARHPATLDDYAFFIAGLLDLYETTSRLDFLSEAIALEMQVQGQYEDAVNGGFFFTAEDHGAPLVRQKRYHDQAEPSGNAVHVMNLLRLHQFTTRESYRTRALKALRAFGRALKRSPESMTEMLLAVDFLSEEAHQIAVVAPSQRHEAEPLVSRLRMTFMPRRVLAWVAEGEELKAHAELVPWLGGKEAMEGEPTAYVCQDQVCKLPTRDPDVFAELVSWSPGVLRHLQIPPDNPTHEGETKSHED